MEKKAAVFEMLVSKKVTKETKIEKTNKNAALDIRLNEKT